jgi:hypothetical protein
MRLAHRLALFVTLTGLGVALIPAIAQNAPPAAPALSGCLDVEIAPRVRQMICPTGPATSPAPTSPPVTAPVTAPAPDKPARPATTTPARAEPAKTPTPARTIRLIRAGEVSTLTVPANRRGEVRLIRAGQETRVRVTPRR